VVFLPITFKISKKRAREVPCKQPELPENGFECKDRGIFDEVITVQLGKKTHHVKTSAFFAKFRI